MKVKYIILSLSFWVICVNTYAQNAIAKKVHSATSNKTIEVDYNFFQENNSIRTSDISNNVFKGELVYLNVDLSKKEQLGDIISLNVPLTTPVIIDLIDVSHSFNNYVVTTSSGNTYSSNKSQRFYRGIVRGNQKSLAVLTITENEVNGHISFEGKNYSVVKKGDIHLLYDNKGIQNTPDFICSSTDDNTYTSDQINKILQQASAMRSTEEKCIRFLMEAEYDMYEQLGSISAVENFVIALMNQVSAIYEMEDINVVISEIKVWDTVDPFDGNSVDTLADYDEYYDSFSPSGSNFNGDFAHLLSFRVSGGIAWKANDLCRSTLKTAVSGLNPYDPVLPNYSYNVFVITHETGHNLGSPHTHACVWNGNGTPIDGCGPAAGYSEGCTGPIPSNGGTVMSYCHLTSVGVGVDLSLGFHEQPAALIHSLINNSTCFSSCESEPEENCESQLVIIQDINGTSDTFLASETIEGINTIDNGASVEYSAGNDIVLKSGFKAINDSSFFAHIEGCESTTPLPDPDTQPLPLPSKFLTENLIHISPNPNEGLFNINLDIERDVSIQIFDINSSLILDKDFKGKKSIPVDINTHPSGFYFLRVTLLDLTDTKVYTKTIIKK